MTGRILPYANIIEVRQGDSFVIKLKIHKGVKDFDLTDAKVNMQVRNIEDNALKFDLTAEPIDAQKGEFALLISPTESNIDVGSYKTDIQLSTSDGQINTIFPADVNKVAIFRITEQVTHE